MIDKEEINWNIPEGSGLWECVECGYLTYIRKDESFEHCCLVDSAIEYKVTIKNRKI